MPRQRVPATHTDRLLFVSSMHAIRNLDFRDFLPYYPPPAEKANPDGEDIPENFRHSAGRGIRFWYSMILSMNRFLLA